MEGILIPFPLYKQVQFTCNYTYNPLLRTYWKLIINLYNLVEDCNYGVMTDIQTVFLVELCFRMHIYMKRYLASKSSQYTTIKRLESCITAYNDSIQHSDNKYVIRYMPTLIKKRDNYRLSIPWEKRVKMYSIAVCNEVLPSIIYSNS